MQFSQEIPSGGAFPPGADAGPAVQADSTPAPLQRARGEAAVSFKRRGPASVLDQVHQSGCCKLRFPKALDGGQPEAVFINTSGGLTDGDEISLKATWASGTSASITTQAAERIYKSRGNPAKVANRLSVGADATALWLPQETILFDGGRLERRLETDLATGSKLIACESIIFGRTAMGETVSGGSLLDAWRIRREGKLVFADGLALAGDMQATLDRRAVAGGARALATVVVIAEEAERMVDPVRKVLAGGHCRAGCSCMGEVLVVRILGATGAEMRESLTCVLRRLLEQVAENEESTARLPRVWAL